MKIAVYIQQKFKPRIADENTDDIRMEDPMQSTEKTPIRKKSLIGSSNASPIRGQSIKSSPDRAYSMKSTPVRSSQVRSARSDKEPELTFKGFSINNTYVDTNKHAFPVNKALLDQYLPLHQNVLKPVVNKQEFTNSTTEEIAAVKQRYQNHKQLSQMIGETSSEQFEFSQQSQEKIEIKTFDKRIIEHRKEGHLFCFFNAKDIQNTGS